MFAAAGLLSFHFYQTPNECSAEWNENNVREEELNEMPNVQDGRAVIPPPHKSISSLVYNLSQ